MTVNDWPLPSILMSQERYSSYDSGIGAKIDKGETSLEELEVLWLIFSD